MRRKERVEGGRRRRRKEGLGGVGSRDWSNTLWCCIAPIANADKDNPADNDNDVSSSWELFTGRSGCHYWIETSEGWTNNFPTLTLFYIIYPPLSNCGFLYFFINWAKQDLRWIKQYIAMLPWNLWISTSDFMCYIFKSICKHSYFSHTISYLHWTRTFYVLYVGNCSFAL